MRFTSDNSSNRRYVIRSYTYDAFGVQASPDVNDLNPFRYAGEYVDKETGYTYLRARYYQPSTGRFLTEDTHWNQGNMIYGDNGNSGIPNITAIKQSGNVYVYTANNPISYIEPTGFRTYIVNGINNTTEGDKGPRYARDLRDKLEAKGVKDVRVMAVFQVKDPNGKIVGSVLNTLDGVTVIA